MILWSRLGGVVAGRRWSMSVPVTEAARQLQERVGEERWGRLEEEARRRAGIVAEVLARHEGGLALRKSVEAVAPGLDWSTFLHWRRRYDGRDGPEWERLLDERVPPPAPAVAEDVRAGARAVRILEPSANTERAREMLVGRFGERGNVSDATLRRIWADAGLKHERSRERSKTAPVECDDVECEDEEVVEFHGGGGLALLAAADAELGTSVGLARAIQRVGEMHANAREPQEGAAQEPGPETRNARGQFTAAYNAGWREGVEDGTADARWATDEDKRARRDLRSLTTLVMKSPTLATKLLCMGATPLLTERRGFDGLDGPAGGWLGVLGGTAYMPATLDKALAELALLDVGDALWREHGRSWHQASRRWTEDGPPWRRFVAYIDATKDPHWTRRFAMSGKVERIGRVMPCLTRIAVHSGPGVGLLVETHPGTVSLSKKLIPMLKRLDDVVGEGEVGRLAVVDAEMAATELLCALNLELERGFITLLKGPIVRAAGVKERGEWMAYRERDELREMDVVLKGSKAPAEGMYLRGVEMRRTGTRHEHTTMFVTNIEEDALPTTEVADAYLSRWPHQEQRFRNGRNGGGLNRSHGYGGQYVQHVALETRLEHAERSVQWNKRRLAEAELAHKGIEDDLAAETEASEALQRSLPIVRRAVARASKSLERAEHNLARQKTMPREIYARDTTRDEIMTCLNLTVMMLVEFVLKEYFGGLRMEWRTFIEQFLYLPVTVRTSRDRVLHQIHANPRQPARTAELRAACNAINRRNIIRGKHRLVFEVLDPTDGRGS